MASDPVTIKLRCNSWGQLATMYKRDLVRSALFLKAKKPPAIGTKIRVNLTLPSDTLIVLDGSVARHIPPGGMDGRGPGVDVQLHSISQSAMWLIESALASAKEKSTSALRKLPTGATQQASRQGRAAPTVRPQEETQDDASFEDGSHLVEAEGDLVGALEEELESLRKLNPFQILDVPYQSDDEAVRAAFARLTKRYHPDRFAKYQSAEARTCASEIFILIRDAYRRVGNAAVRKQTLLALRKQATAARAAASAQISGRAPAPTPTPTPTPRPRPQKHPPPRPAPRPASTPTPPPAPAAKKPAAPPPADSALSTSDLFGDSAERGPAPSRPVELPGARSRTSSHSRADGLVEAGKYQDALALYGIAARRNPGDTLARAGVELCEGLKALAERDRLEAAQRFEAVLELDPTNERAARELAEMRRQATADRKGLLARLLGKKE